MISLTSVVSLVIYILVSACIFWLLNYLINMIAPPEPWNKFARVALAVLGVLVIIGILLSFVNGTPVFRT